MSGWSVSPPPSLKKTVPIVCIVGFILQSRETIDKFISGRTTKAFSDIPPPGNGGLKFPAITICLEPYFHLKRMNSSGLTPFAWNMFHFLSDTDVKSEEMMQLIWPGNSSSRTFDLWLNSTFHFDEFVHTVEVHGIEHHVIIGQDFNNNEAVDVNEVHTKYNGRCHTITARDNLTFSTNKGITIVFKHPWKSAGYSVDRHDLKFLLFVHEPGAEVNAVAQMWRTEPLVSHVRPGHFTDLTFKKYIGVDYVRDSECESRMRTHYEWNECLDTYLTRATRHLNCTIPMSMLPNNRLLRKEICTDPNEARNVVSEERTATLGQTEKLRKQCPALRQSVTYRGGERMFSIHGSDSAELSIAYIFYADLSTTLEETIKLYDFNAIVSAVGGSLGLFLGFSCLDLMYALNNMLFKKLS